MADAADDKDLIDHIRTTHLATLSVGVAVIAIAFVQSPEAIRNASDDAISIEYITRTSLDAEGFRRYAANSGAPSGFAKYQIEVGEVAGAELPAEFVLLPSDGPRGAPELAGQQGVGGFSLQLANRFAHVHRSNINTTA